MAIDVVWESQYEDFKATQALHTWSGGASASLFVFTYIVGPAISVLLWIIVVIGLLHHHSQTVITVTPWAVGTTIYALWVWGARIYAFRKAYKNCWPTHSKRRVNSVSLSDEGIRCTTTDVGESRLLWTAFHKILEDEEVLMLYTSKTRWLAVPKRVLDPTQLAELTRLCTTHVRERP